MTFIYLAFFASVFALCYTFVGYPLLLAAWVRLAPRPVLRARFDPDVAIVVVVHNGGNLISRKIATCLAQDYPPACLHLLVVSDGSDDGTVAAVDALVGDRVSLLAFPTRRGKAACLNDAVAARHEEIIVFTDARQVLHPQALRNLVDNFADSTVGAVSGQLVFERHGMTDFGESIDAYWRYEKVLRRMESSIHSTVGATGALYALRRECFREIPPWTILDDVLIPMNVVLQGRRVVFENEALAYDRPSRDARQERVRKVRTLAGNFQLLSTSPALIAPWRNPVALQLISHKLMRLLAPAALAVALITNIVLVREDPFFLVSLALQVAGYAMAAFGLLWPRAGRQRPVKIMSAFVSLNWFTVLGFIEFVSNRNAHLWKSPRPESEDNQSWPQETGQGDK